MTAVNSYQLLKNHVPPSPLSSPSEIFFKDTCYLALVSIPQAIHPSHTVLGRGSKKSLKMPFQGEGSEKRKEVGVGNIRFLNCGLQKTNSENIVCHHF